MKPAVFIHTNAQQFIGAKVAEYSIKKASRHQDLFDVKIIHLQDFPSLMAREGQLYLREGRQVAWRNGDLQSFTLLRFLPPQLMGYQGRAIVIDPDIFALADIRDLLIRDMEGKAIVCRRIVPTDGKPAYYASSAMLLDCSKLKHWRWEEAIGELFAGKRDYRPWMSLLLEPAETIGPLEEEWNHFDTLNETTKMLHNTGRVTQPWKSGLPIDFMAKHPPARNWRTRTRVWLERAKSWARGKTYHSQGTYRNHPDSNQERLFFSLLKECLKEGVLTCEILQGEIRKRHIRPDALTIVNSLESSEANRRIHLG